MKKKVLSLLLTVFMIVGMVPFGAITAFAESGEKEYLKLYNSLHGQTIGDADAVTYYLVDSDITCTADEAGVSGLSLIDWAEVHIIVEAGVTLECTGADGNSRTVGGGAGIEVPEHAKLYLEGEGTVIARGGKAANGSDGASGQSAFTYSEEIADMTFYTCYGGDGGTGGAGGAGAGAGIGTTGSIGGMGGTGGQGDGGDAGEQHMEVTVGQKGFPGAKVKPAGMIRTSRTVKLTADGGAAGKGGSSTISYRNKYIKSEDCGYNTAVPGCSGGGGQGGGAGASVGNGGQGGGGGAGGNGSPAIYNSEKVYYGSWLFSGCGGGNTDGNYVEDSNMGRGEEYDLIDYFCCGLKSDYPYLEPSFGGPGGASSVHVHTFDEDGWCIECATTEWVIDENGVVLKYNGLGGTAVVPEGVTRIANNVFNGNKTVTGIVFPSTLEEIGSSAFFGSGLTTVSFPASVKLIGHNAFQNCLSLTSITFPENGEITILNSTFQGSSLTSVDIPVSVKAIGYTAFASCTNLKSVTVHWTEAEKIITPQSSAFLGIASDCVLFVPSDTAQLYKNNTVWGKFSLISDTMAYMAYDPESETLIQKTTLTAPAELTSSDEPITLTDGWYAVDGEVRIGERITVSGDTNLILKDGCKLTLNKGLEISQDDSLTIYGQSEGTGELITPKLSGDSAAIGVGVDTELNIHGGNIKVQGGKNAAGIGGGNRLNSGTVTVYGGSVTAYGNSGSAGIGGGSFANGGAFTIYGGKVNAYGDSAPAIGGGEDGNGGTVTVNGGEIDASNAIGGKYSTVVINNGKVTVSGDVGGTCSTVEINGGDVKVNNGTIGVGYYSGSNAEITIRGGTVDAGNYYYPAIGGNTSSVNVYIYGGSIKAQSTNMDAVIASSVNVYPDTDECEVYTVKDFSGNELSGSPVAEEKDIIELLSGNAQIKIDIDHVHTFTGDYVDQCDGTHSRKCSVCGILNAPENHTFVNHECVCGVTNEHRFTGEYKDNSDGTHSRKCTECDAYGTPEEHEFDNYVCVCGAEDLASARLKAKSDIEEAVKDAAATASTVIADKALDDVEKAGSLAEINQVVGKAVADIETAEGALLDAKNAALDVLAAEDLINDDNKTVIEDAILTITNAATTESVTAIYDLAMAKIEAIGTIAEARTPENEELAGDGISAVTGATDTEKVEAAKEAALADMKAADDALIQAKTDAKAEINAKKTVANADIAEKALADIDAATLKTTVESVMTKAIADMKSVDDALAQAKTDAKAEINAKKTAANADIADEALSDIDAATTEAAVESVLTKALADMKSVDDALAQAKTDAKAAISDKKTAANADIAEKALADIDAATLKTAVESILTEALADMKAADDALIQAKAEAKDEIESKTTDQNAGIAAAALENINKAGTEDEVDNLLSTALDDMKAADDALAQAKTDAKAEINAKKTAANAAIADKALSDIDAATVKTAVESILTQALADMKTVDDTLAEARANAKAAINEAKSEDNADVAEKAISEIDAAITPEAVESIKNTALEAMRRTDIMAKAEKMLDEAVCDEAKAILSQAITDMLAADSADAMIAVLEEAELLAADEDKAYDAELKYYLEDIDEYIDDFCSDDTVAFIENIKEQLRACKSITGLKAIYDANEDTLDFLYSRDDTADTFRNYSEDPDQPDTVRALAAEALQKVLAAESTEEVDAIYREYYAKMELQWAKYDTIDMYRAYLEDEEYNFSDEMKAIYRDLMQKVMAAEDWKELICLSNEDEIRTDAQHMCEHLFERISLVEEDDLYFYYYYYVEAYETEEYRDFVEATLDQLRQEEEACLAVIDKVRADEEDIDCLDDLTDDFYAFTVFLDDKLNYGAGYSCYLLDSYEYSEPYKVLTREFLEEYVGALTGDDEETIRNAYEAGIELLRNKDIFVENLYRAVPSSGASDMLLALAEEYAAKIMAAASWEEANEIYNEGYYEILSISYIEYLTDIANAILDDESATDTEKAFAQELLDELAEVETHADLDPFEVKYALLSERLKFIDYIYFWINHEEATVGDKSEEFMAAFNNVLATLDGFIDELIPAVKAAETDGDDAMDAVIAPFWDFKAFLTDAVLSDCADYCTYLYQYVKENCTEAHWELSLAYLDEYSKATSYDELNEIDEKYDPLFKLMDIKEDYVFTLREEVFEYVGPEVFESEKLQSVLREGEAYILAAESEEEAEKRFNEISDALYPVLTTDYLTAIANSVLNDKSAPAELKAYASELLRDIEKAEKPDELETLLDTYLLLDIRYYFITMQEEKMNAEDAPDKLKTPEYHAAYENVRTNYNAFITDLIPTFGAAVTEEEFRDAIEAYDCGEELYKEVLKRTASAAELLLNEETSELECKLLRLYIEDVSKVTTYEELEVICTAYDKRDVLLPLKEDKCSDLKQMIIEDGNTDELWTIYEEQEMKILLAEDKDEVQDLYNETLALLECLALREYLLEYANEILNDKNASEIQEEFTRELITAVTNAQNVGELLTEWNRHYPLVLKAKILRDYEEAQTSEEAPDFFKTDEFRAAFENIMATLNSTIDSMIPDFRAANDEELDDLNDYFYECAEALYELQLDIIWQAVEDMTKVPRSDAMKALYFEYIDAVSRTTSQDQLEKILEEYEAKFQLLEYKEKYIEIIQDILEQPDTDPLTVAQAKAVLCLLDLMTIENSEKVDAFIKLIIKAETVDEVEEIKEISLIYLDLFDCINNAYNKINAAKTADNADVADNAIEAVKVLQDELDNNYILFDEELKNEFKDEVNAILEKALKDMRGSDFDPTVIILDEESTCEIIDENGIKYVLDIQPKTTVAYARGEFCNEGLVFVDANGNVIGENDIIGTGAKVQIIDDETDEVIYEVTVIIAGDIDGDGIIKSVDALMALKQSVGVVAGTKETLLAGDLDESGKISSTEALRILKYSVGVISSLK